MRHARAGFSRTPLAATAPSKHVYTSHELNRHTYRAISHGCNFLLSNLPSELARSRGPMCCTIRVQSRFGLRSRSRTATSPGLALSLSFSHPAPVSSDESKESSACTHRVTSAVRVLIGLTQCSRAHAAATWRSCCGSCAWSRVASGGSTCTTGICSKDLAGCGMRVPPVSIAKCLADGCARRARDSRRRVVVEVVERREDAPRSYKSVAGKHVNTVKRK